jgi:triacylglycerol lipase
MVFAELNDDQTQKLGATMEPLTPQQAAKIASKVYFVGRESNIQDAAKLADNFGLDELFTLDGAKRFDGTSGNVILNSNKSFGFMAKGRGDRKNECLIAIRGTSSLYDAFTDVNLAFDRGPSGHCVHAGFNRTFKSYSENLSSIVEGFKPSGVHVIGHSLGGALATLTAEYLNQKGIDVKLYNFGAPRSGLTQHSQYLTKCLPARNIYRVYHSTDPVSMLPIFPYQHIPFTPSAYFIQRNGTIDINAHYMDSYIDSIRDSGWNALSIQSPVPGLRKQAQEYLEGLSSGGGVGLLCGRSLVMIGYALDAILRELG